MLYEMLKSKFEVREEYDALFGYGKEIMFGASFHHPFCLNVCEGLHRCQG